MSSSETIPDFMKAAVVLHPKDTFVIKQVKTPMPQKNQVLVKIAACGVCHTDVHAIDGDWPSKANFPLIAGHEGAGWVVKLGEDVTHIEIGDRVGIPWLFSACGCCENCIGGWETVCCFQKNTGYNKDGCFAEYVVADASFIVKIPSTIPFTQAAPLMCAGLTSYKGLKETETKPGQFCTIMGAAGGLGHLAIQFGKAMGMRIIAVDVGAEKMSFCKDIGAEFVVDATSPDCVQKVCEYTNGGSHGVLCLATCNDAFLKSVQMTRRVGTVVCVGLPKGSFETDIFDIVVKRITIRGSVVGTRKDLKEALDFAARGLICCNVETDVLGNVSGVLEKLRQSKIQGRVVLDINLSANPPGTIKEGMKEGMKEAIGGTEQRECGEQLHA
eukprot:gene8655-17858_t